MLHLYFKNILITTWDLESSSGEAIEGISQAQWEAFTIEEQFSQCQLSQCSKCLPNSEAIYTRNVIRMAEQNNEIIITGTEIN